MCTGKQTKESASGGCRGNCADLAQAKAPEAEVQKQKTACHGEAETPVETGSCE